MRRTRASARGGGHPMAMGVVGLGSEISDEACHGGSLAADSGEIQAHAGPRRTGHLHEAHGIDVDLELEVALPFGRDREPSAQVVGEIEAARRLQQDAKPMAAAHDRQRGFGGAEHAHLVGARRNGGEAAGIAFSGRPLPGRHEQAGEPPERRIAGRFTQRDFARVERVAIGRHQCAHHRMIGLMSLEIADAVAGLAPGTADHLVQQLEGALRSARIAVGQAEIGIYHADQIELGKVMSFRHQLRADDDVEAAFGYVIELRPQALHGFHEVAREHQDAAAGKELRRLLLQPLDPGTDRHERLGRLALRT